MNRFCILTSLNMSMKYPKTSYFIKILSSLTLIFFLALGKLNAQELNIIEVDSSAYPSIKLSVVFKGNTKFESDQLFIKQNSKKIEFNVNKISGEENKEVGRAVFFLLEATGNTAGRGMVDIREGISGALDNLYPEDVLNIAWFSSFDKDSVDMRTLSKDFSKEHSKLRKLMYKINASPDSLERSDLYKSILEGLNYVSRTKNLPERKLFIVLSTSRNNSSSPITSSECIAKAKELNIPVFSVTYIENDSVYTSNSMTRLSARTGGKNVQAKNQIGIINAVTDFFNAPLPQALQDSQYEISFNVGMETNPTMAKIDINYKGNRQIVLVKDPAAGNIIPEDFKPYLWYSIGILGFVVVVMIMVNIFSRKKSHKEKGGETNEDSPHYNMDSSTEEKTTKSLDKETIMPAFREEIITKLDAASNDDLPILLLNIEGRTVTFPIQKSLVTLGRHETNDICLSEITVTGKHAIIKVHHNEISIEDLGSTNGTFVNGERIRKCILKPGDKITLGNIVLTLKE